MTTDKTAVALRVLTAINRRQMPEERDIALLRAYSPDTRDLAPDEAACIVIQEAIRQRHRQRDQDSPEAMKFSAGN